MLFKSGFRKLPSDKIKELSVTGSLVYRENPLNYMPDFYTFLFSIIFIPKKFMENSNPPKKPGIRSFNRNFWTVITMEFFERGSYYGVMSVLSVYLVLSIDKGGLGFSKESVGIIKSTITPLLYLLPIISGAIGDRFGYRKVLMFSFIFMSIGYFLTSISASYEMVFLSLIVVVLGAGFFKPLITGTIARETNETNSSLGFGVYYWSINLGAFLFPLVLVPVLKNLSWSYIFIMASVCTGSLLLLNFFVFREPDRKSVV